MCGYNLKRGNLHNSRCITDHYVAVAMGLSESIRRITNSLGFGRGGEGNDTRERCDGQSKAPHEVLEKLQDSASDSDASAIFSEIDDSSGNLQNGHLNDQNEEDGIAFSDVSLQEDSDIVPYQKTTINNTVALSKGLKAIQLPASAKENFYEHMSIDSKDPIVLKDIYDDPERELSFYKQSLDAVRRARNILVNSGIPFTRPDDYFAEMVKSDEHMEKLRQKIIKEAAAEKAKEDSRKQRELKKYGKLLQHAKLQERQKEKSSSLNKIKSLKRKRQSGDLTSDQFDVEIEDALKDPKEERNKRYKLGAVNARRRAKNERYGHGGKKRGKRLNTEASLMDMSVFQNSNRHKKKGR